MIRRISSLAFGFAVTFAAAGALAQEEGGEKPAEGGGEAAAPAEGGEGGGDAAKPAEGGGEAAAAGSAEASGPPDTGGKIKLGLRIGYGLPMGESAKGSNLNDTVSGMIPIWLDLGYMVTPNIMVGLYAQYGLLMIKDCPSGASCSGNDMRFGLQGQYHLSPGESLNPWFGLGIGYEMLSYKIEVSGVSGEGKLSGLEFANLQAGADFKAGPADVGPFVSFSLGQYSKAEAGGVSGDITEKAMHQWLVFGIKGTFGF